VRGASIVSGDAALRASQDSLRASLLGRDARPSVRHPFQSLDELLEIPGINEGLLARVASLLTVDGDGRINRRSAPPAVMAAAAGSLVDRPTRLLCVARGWQRGQALSREIQAVYEVADDGLRLVRWREQGR
jgi:type II secretory pathway component PulK